MYNIIFVSLNLIQIKIFALFNLNQLYKQNMHMIKLDSMYKKGFTSFNLIQI